MVGNPQHALSQTLSIYGTWWQRTHSSLPRPCSSGDSALNVSGHTRPYMLIGYLRHVWTSVDSAVYIHWVLPPCMVTMQCPPHRKGGRKGNTRTILFTGGVPSERKGGREDKTRTILSVGGVLECIQDGQFDLPTTPTGLTSVKKEKRRKGACEN